jgi:hypothetical protein
MRLEPPGGVMPPSVVAGMDGSSIPLAGLAEAACDRYFSVYRDDVEGLGPSGRLWCDHDSRYLLAWALQDARSGDIDCVERVAWLGAVLGARSFPVDRLVRHVELTASVLRDAELGRLGVRAAQRLQTAAHALRNGARVDSPGELPEDG